MRALHSSIRSAPLRRSMASKAKETPPPAAAAAAVAAAGAPTDDASRFYKHGLVSLDPQSKHAAPNLLCAFFVSVF